MIEVFRDQAADGTEPVTDWLGSLRDKQAQARVRLRIKRLEARLFGACQPVGDGVLELREHFGAGFRIHLARHGDALVILRGGGTKRTQAADIRAAKKHWADWKRRQR